MRLYYRLMEVMARVLHKMRKERKKERKKNIGWFNFRFLSSFGQYTTLSSSPGTKIFGLTWVFQTVSWNCNRDKSHGYWNWPPAIFSWDSASNTQLRLRQQSLSSPYPVSFKSQSNFIRLSLISIKSLLSINLVPIESQLSLHWIS